MQRRAGLQIEVLCQDVGHPVIHLNPETLHFIAVLTLLHHLIPRLRIDAGIQMHAIGFYPGFFFSRVVGNCPAGPRQRRGER